MVRCRLSASTPQIPFKIPHIPTNKDLNRGTLGGLSVACALDCPKALRTEILRVSNPKTISYSRASGA